MYTYITKTKQVSAEIQVPWGGQHKRNKERITNFTSNRFIQKRFEEYFEEIYSIHTLKQT